MADNDLVVIISAQTARFESAMDRIAEKTESLNDKLEKLSVAAGIAFAAATAEIGLSVRAYATQEEATNRLSQAFITQGIYSRQLVESYRAQADAIQNKTGVDNEAIVSGQTLLQGYLGQKTITQDLTQAVVDFATAQKIDLESAFDLVGKSVAGQVNALGRYGVQLNDSMSSSEKLDAITKQLSERFAGTAEAAAQGLGGIKILTASFEDLQKAIGEKFAPIISTAISGTTKLIQAISSNKEVLNFTVAMLAATAAVTGATFVAAAGGVAFLKLRAALIAAQVATNATKIAVQGLVGATGIGLLVIAATEIYLHWNTIWPAMQKTFHAFADGIISISGGIGKVLHGIFHLDTAEIKAGMQEITNAFKKEYDDLAKTAADGNAKVRSEDKSALDDQAAARKAAADKAEADRKAMENRRLAAAKAQHAVLVAEANNESKELIAIKKEQADTLSKIENEKNAKIRSSLEKHLKDLEVLEKNQEKQDLARKKKFNNDILKGDEGYRKMDEKQQKIFLQKHGAQLQESIDTEETALDKYAVDRANLQIQSDNQFLQDQIKFGTAYAAINQAMHSEIYQGTKKAFGELAELQQSSNNTLKAIGKVAAIANIVIKTAESAMNIYEGFSTIPIIGPALGIAGAAAAVAFGAEQVQKVNAANQGGVIQGFGPDQDSVLLYGTPGELVVPRKNFDETVNAVAAQRSGTAGGTGSNDNTEVLSDIRDQLKTINSKFSAPTVIQGDVMADRNFVDALIRKITDAVRYNNANLVATRVKA